MANNDVIFYGLGDPLKKGNEENTTAAAVERVGGLFDQPMELTPVVELAAGLTSEEVKALFFDPFAMRESVERIYRIDRKGHRYYYIFDEKGLPIFFPSNTTFITQTMPTSPFLIKWMADMGYEKAEEYKNERAAYGTFMHGEYARLAIEFEYDLDRMKSALDIYIQKERLPIRFMDYVDDLQKNILAFAQFMIEYDVKPLAVEIPLICRIGGFGCTIDLACELTYGGKQIRAIIDFKSGKGFYESNEIQLHACKMAWNENFPDLKIDHVFNFRPKDWRSKPTFEFKDQTKSINANKLPYLLKIAEEEDKNVDNNFTICKGKIYLDSKDLAQNFETCSLSELVKKVKKEKEPEKVVPIDLESSPAPRSGRKKAEKEEKAEKPPIPQKEQKVDDQIKNELLDFNADF